MANGLADPSETPSASSAVATPRVASTRPLGFVSLLALGINGVVGVGIFFAPASRRRRDSPHGYLGVLMYVVTALALWPIAFGYAALGGRFDIDGGPYVWANAAFGPRFGFLVGWVTYVSSMFSVAAVVSGLAHHAAPLFGITGSVAIRDSPWAARCSSRSSRRPDYLRGGGREKERRR